MEQEVPKKRGRPRKEKKSTKTDAKRPTPSEKAEAEPEVNGQGPSTSRENKSQGSTSIQGTPKGPTPSTTPDSGIFSLGTMPSRLILAPEVVQSLRRNPLIWELPASIPALTVTPAAEEPERGDKREQLRIDELEAVSGEMRRKKGEKTRKKSITPSPSELEEIYSEGTALDSSETESESDEGTKRGGNQATEVPSRRTTKKSAVQTRDSGSQTEEEKEVVIRNLNELRQILNTTPRQPKPLKPHLLVEAKNFLCAKNN